MLLSAVDLNTVRIALVVLLSVVVLNTVRIALVVLLLAVDLNTVRTFKFAQGLRLPDLVARKRNVEEKW